MKAFGAIAIFLLLISSAHAQLLPPHAALPDGATCASKVNATPEIRPSNARFNSYVPTATELAPFYAQPLGFTSGPPFSDFYRVDGNFRGTTDQIIAWAACKWGADPEQFRAQAWAESSWNQTVQGDIQYDHKLCTGGNGWDSWQPNGGYCYTSFSLIQIKCSDYYVCPTAQNSVAFAMDFRGAYWRACMDGDVKYYRDSKPSAGYPTYPNGTTEQMSDGCMGSWYSGNWFDSSALPYIETVHKHMTNKPWLPSFRFTAPKPDQTVSGRVNVAIAYPVNPGVCFYACLNADSGFVSCVPGQGPWSWDTTIKVPNGVHTLTANAYTCGLSSGNDLPIGWPTASVMVNVANSAAATSYSSKKRKW